MTKTKILIALLALVCFASCDNYGTKTTNGNIDTYYKEGITEGQAKKTAALFYEMDKLTSTHDEKVQKSVQLIKKNDTVCLRMVVDEAKAKGMGDMVFLPISNIISDSVFNGSPVNMDLTDKTFKTIKTIPYKKVNLEELEKGNQ